MLKVILLGSEFGLILPDFGNLGNFLVQIQTRKSAIAKALQLKGHSDFAPVHLAYYEHFLVFFCSKILRFGKVPRGNHKCRSRDAKPLVNNKLESVQLQKHCISNAERHCARRCGFFWACLV